MLARWIVVAPWSCLVPCLALAQDAAPVASATYDLRAAPAQAVGDRTRERLVHAQTGVVVAKRDKGGDEVNRVDQRVEFDVLEEVLALAPTTGTVERVQRTYERVRNGELTRSFADRPILLVRKPDGTEAPARPTGAGFDDRSTRQLVALRKAERAQSQPALDAVVPATPVAVGDRWTLASDGVAALVALFDMGILRPADLEPDEVLEAEGSLAGVESKGGVDLLHVELRLRLAITDLDCVTCEPPAELVLTARYVTAGAASRLRSLACEGTFRGTLAYPDGTRVSRDLRLVSERRVDAVERGE